MNVFAHHTGQHCRPHWIRTRIAYAATRRALIVVLAALRLTALREVTPR